MIISFLFLIFSAAVFIDCQEDRNLTSVKKTTGHLVNGQTLIMQALARLESTIQHQSQQQQVMRTSVADLRTAVADIQTRIAELRTKVTDDATALVSNLKMVQCTNATTGSESQKARFPVAFTARFSRDDSANGISLGHHSILRLDKVVTNIGDAYDPHTGIFTAPVNGVYVFFVSIMAADKQGSVNVAIETEHKVLDYMYARARGGYQGSGLVTTNMTAGQQAYVRQDYGSRIRGGQYTIFSGYLL